MNIIGIGTDIIEISRISAAMEKPGFLKKLYTSAEQEYINSKSDRSQTAAGMFAAKEAAAKAMGTGFGKFSPTDIEILYDENGAPYARISKAPEVTILVSISHCRKYAAANAAAFKEN